MTAADYIIRNARPADIPALGPIEAAGDAQFPAGRFPGEPGSDNVPVAELEQAAAAGLLRVAEVSGSIVAFAMAVIHGDALYLRQLAVRPEFQCRGIGTALIESLNTELRERRLSEMTLTTFEDIPWNAPYYARRGFRVVPETDLAPYLREELEAERRAGMMHRVAMVRRKDWK